MHIAALFGEAWERTRRRRRRQLGFGAAGIAVIAIVAGAVIGLSYGASGGSGMPGSPIRTSDAVAPSSIQTPRLLIGAPAGPVRAADANQYQGAAILSSVRLVAETADIHRGLPWGLRAFRTTRGMTCLQVGRVQAGVIGVIGDDGAWADDGLFHPIAANAYTADDSCDQTDRNGYAFATSFVNGKTASADVQWGTGLQSDGCGGPAERQCPAGSLRDLAFGLLGPDATSITYRGAHDRLYREATNPPFGAYLIVEAHSTDVPPDQTADSTLLSGPVVKITYRGGRTCTVSSTARRAQSGGCPPVGYVAPAIHTASPAMLAAPITVRELPARHYCASGRLTLAPCRPGQTPLRGVNNYLLVDISFSAHIAIPTTNSYYQQTETNQQNPNCTGGDAKTLDNVRAGQRVLFQDQIPYRCHGTIHGTISYVPSSGPGGSDSALTIPKQRGSSGSVIVGRYAIHIP